jgi:pseudouridine-5'-phosphate glycosidase
MTSQLDIRPAIRQALRHGEPVVALETTVLAHGLPRPANLETALAMEAGVRQEKATPATIGLLEGRMVVGLDEAELHRLGTEEGVYKVSRRDLGPILQQRRPGATTVAATAWIAAQAGIGMMATGGIGGVHRGAQLSFDVSADLGELARTPLGLVCSGAKVILDLPATLEVLETLGVPVVGFGADEFPAFYCAESGLPLDHRVETPEEAARLLRLQRSLGLSAAVIFAAPPPAAEALSRARVEALLETALETAGRQGIRGKAVTPFLLKALAEASGGRTLEANRALLLNNARLAARIARAASSETTVSSSDLCP